MPRRPYNYKKTYSVSVKQDVHERINRIAKNVGTSQQEIADYLLTSALEVMEETLTEKLLELRYQEQLVKQAFMRKRASDIRKQLSEMLVIPLNP